MTQRKNGLASYDNDQQRAIDAESGLPMYEKGSAMERGTAHEFGSEGKSEAGEKDLRSVDPAPGVARHPAGKPVHTGLGPDRIGMLSVRGTHPTELLARRTL